LDPSTDSGVKGDSITTITAPQIDGKGTAGDTITLYDGTTVVGTGPVSGDGTWAITTDVLPVGTHSLSATQTDSAGNMSIGRAARAITLAKPPAPEDLDCHGVSDLVFQNSSTGQVEGWELNGASVIASGVIGNPGNASWKLVGSHDLNGDGHADLLFQNAGNG